MLGTPFLWSELPVGVDYDVLGIGPFGRCRYIGKVSEALKEVSTAPVEWGRVRSPVGSRVSIVSSEIIGRPSSVVSPSPDNAKVTRS